MKKTLFSAAGFIDKHKITKNEQGEESSNRLAKSRVQRMNKDGGILKVEFGGRMYQSVYRSEIH